MDDGIICKINDKHFIATTTSGGAPKVFAHMEEFLQTEWPHLQVYLNSITEQFTTFNISGPKAREIVGKVFYWLCSYYDFSWFPRKPIGN